MDSDSDIGQSLTSNEDGSERLIYGCGNNQSGRPMVDSGAFTSCCPKNYAREVQIEKAPPLNLKSVLGESIQHYGVRKNLEFSSSGGKEKYTHDFQVTDCIRPILSVRACNQRAELVCFGPNEKRIITDSDAIAKIEAILRKASGHQIIGEKGSYVLEGFRKEVTEYKPVMPVVREKTIQRGLSLVAVKIEDEDVNKDFNFDARISDSEVKAKVPSPGSAERRRSRWPHNCGQYRQGLRGR